MDSYRTDLLTCDYRPNLQTCSATLIFQELYLSIMLVIERGDLVGWAGIIYTITSLYQYLGLPKYLIISILQSQFLCSALSTLSLINAVEKSFSFYSILLAVALLFDTVLGFAILSERSEF